MKIITMLRDTNVGSRLYSQGIEYEMEEEIAEKLIASGDAEAAEDSPDAAKDEPPSTS